MTLWETLTPSQQFKTLENMRDYGGHFAQAIGKAWMYADSGNHQRLVNAFPDLIEKYQPKNWNQHEKTHSDN